MKEQLVALLISRVGLDQQKAEQAVDTVLEYIQNNPQQISQLLGHLPGGLGDKLGGLFG
ncbi:MAG TPA: hypothetical protein VNN73_06390 [Blastocatellia bacterium]|nr:hypothetical protein [Blastocatellia bacterium]